jgi:hypothetical protein
MKFMNLFFFALLSFVLVACNNEVKPTQQASASAPESLEVAPSDTVQAAVTMIGVSKITTDFTPYPECDGGECYTVKFTIGLKLQGEDASRSVDVYVDTYGMKAGVTKTAPEIKDAQNLHSTLSAINPEKVAVILVNNKITEIASIEEWQGKTFVPKTVLWKAKEH